MHDRVPVKLSAEQKEYFEDLRSRIDSIETDVARNPDLFGSKLLLLEGIGKIIQEEIINVSDIKNLNELLKVIASVDSEIEGELKIPNFELKQATPPVTMPPEVVLTQAGVLSEERKQFLSGLAAMAIEKARGVAGRDDDQQIYVGVAEKLLHAANSELEPSSIFFRDINIELSKIDGNDFYVSEYFQYDVNVPLQRLQREIEEARRHYSKQSDRTRVGKCNELLDELRQIEALDPSYHDAGIIDVEAEFDEMNIVESSLETTPVESKKSSKIITATSEEAKTVQEIDQDIRDILEGKLRPTEQLDYLKEFKRQIEPGKSSTHEKIRLWATHIIKQIDQCLSEQRLPTSTESNFIRDLLNNIRKVDKNNIIEKDLKFIIPKYKPEVADEYSESKPEEAKTTSEKSKLLNHLSIQIDDLFFKALQLDDNDTIIADLNKMHREVQAEQGKGGDLDMLFIARIQSHMRALDKRLSERQGLVEPEKIKKEKKKQPASLLKKLKVSPFSVSDKKELKSAISKYVKLRKMYDEGQSVYKTKFFQTKSVHVALLILREKINALSEKMGTGEKESDLLRDKGYIDRYENLISEAVKIGNIERSSPPVTLAEYENIIKQIEDYIRERSEIRKTLQDSPGEKSSVLRKLYQNNTKLSSNTEEVRLRGILDRFLKSKMNFDKSHDIVKQRDDLFAAIAAKLNPSKHDALLRDALSQRLARLEDSKKKIDPLTVLKDNQTGFVDRYYHQHLKELNANERLFAASLAEAEALLKKLNKQLSEIDVLIKDPKTRAQFGWLGNEYKKQLMDCKERIVSAVSHFDEDKQAVHKQCLAAREVINKQDIEQVVVLSKRIPKRLANLRSVVAKYYPYEQSKLREKALHAIAIIENKKPRQSQVSALDRDLNKVNDAILVGAINWIMHDIYELKQQLERGDKDLDFDGKLLKYFDLAANDIKNEYKLLFANLTDKSLSSQYKQMLELAREVAEMAKRKGYFVESAQYQKPRELVDLEPRPNYEDIKAKPEPVEPTGDIDELVSHVGKQSERKQEAIYELPKKDSVTDDLNVELKERDRRRADLSRKAVEESSKVLHPINLLLRDLQRLHNMIRKTKFKQNDLNDIRECIKVIRKDYHQIQIGEDAAPVALRNLRSTIESIELIVRPGVLGSDKKVVLNLKPEIKAIGELVKAVDLYTKAQSEKLKVTKEIQVESEHTEEVMKVVDGKLTNVSMFKQKPAGETDAENKDKPTHKK